MKRIQLDGRSMTTREEAHSCLKQGLDLPEHYGGNLDALADCLGELSGVSILLTHTGMMLDSLGEYGSKLIRVMRSAAKGRDDLRFRVRKGFSFSRKHRKDSRSDGNGCC